MKTKKNTQWMSLTFTTLCMFLFIATHAQIQFQGLINENEGAASWNADGSGPEPFGDGHGTFLYYVASRDYVNPASTAGGHALSVGSEFPLFAEALTANGYTPAQVRMKMGLASLGDDIEGIDWFFMDNEDYLNFYPMSLSLTLNEEPMISGEANYIMFQYGVSTGFLWFCESNFFKPVNASGGSSAAVQAVAAAFLQDVGNLEVRLMIQTFGTTVNFSNNGRSGTYFNFNGSLATGLPQLPIQGLAANHEGFAGWDADGTGPEPKRDGHDGQLYYIASRDYNGIDPDPNACFARFLSEGGQGFQNFALQLEYRGLDPEQIKLKMGLRNLDEDIEGEDWSYNYPIHAVNYYQSINVAELNGEPLFGFVCDTLKSCQNVNNPNLGWWGNSAKTLMYNASENSSEAIQAVAMSFFKDLEDRQIHTETTLITSVTGTINSCGRTGGFWQINEAKIVASPLKGTQIQAGNVSGNWTIEGNPYIVEGNITVPDGQTLTIDPGVWVKFTDRIDFAIHGSIHATGDTSNTGSIRFTAVNPGLGWGHIVFDSTNTNNPASVFRHCIFEHGSAPPPIPISSPSNCGGAIGIRQYNNVVIENCLFHHNNAQHDGVYRASGGAIALWTSSPVIRNCVFSNNIANWSGAIACAFGSSPEIVNCLFYGNQSLRYTWDGGGAIIVSANSNPRLLNNTFVKNHSNFKGGALEIYDGSNPHLINNVFWGNTAPQNSQIFISSGNCNVDIRYNNIEGGEAGIGPNGIGSGVYENNLEVDPSFADTLALDFQLSEGSPCMDAGTPDTTGLNLPLYDLLYNVRFWDGDDDGHAFVDMGPYEFAAPLYSEIKAREYENSGLVLTCFPNPFTDRVEILYENVEPGMVRLIICNQLGQPVAKLINQLQSEGLHKVIWNTADLPSGIYYCCLQAGNHTATGKIILTR
jgi:hypothetical protein